MSRLSFLFSVLLLVAFAEQSVAQATTPAEQSPAQGNPGNSKTGVPTLAILDFEGSKDIQVEQLQAITDRFQSEIIRRKAFRVLDRNQMDAVLKEQGFQQTGVCASNDCQVKVGQLLGVDKILSGKVVAFDRIWAISLRYMDVATGQVENVFSYEVEGGLVDVLRKGCAQGADQLSLFMKPQIPVAQPGDNPSGAKPVEPVAQNMQEQVPVVAPRHASNAPKANNSDDKWLLGVSVGYQTMEFGAGLRMGIDIMPYAGLGMCLGGDVTFLSPHDDWEEDLGVSIDAAMRLAGYAGLSWGASSSTDRGGFALQFPITYLFDGAEASDVDTEEVAFTEQEIGIGFRPTMVGWKGNFYFGVGTELHVARLSDKEEYFSFGNDPDIFGFVGFQL